MHATFVMLWLQVMQPLANVHEAKWTPHVKRESDVAVHIIAVISINQSINQSISFIADKLHPYKSSNKKPSYLERVHIQ